MKNHFIKLLKYDHYANQQILEVIRAANNPEKPVQLMAHLLAAQQRWLSRCKRELVADNELWPKTETASFEGLMATQNQAWITYLNNLSPADMEQTVTYKTSAGTQYTDKLVDILTHLINHGTHHRAQIGQQLKQVGVETLPPLDYILFIRN